MKTTSIIGITILTTLLSITTSFADTDTGKGRAKATSAYFNQGDGVMVTIKGNAAQVMFDEINFEDIQTHGSLLIEVNGRPVKPSGIEIRQSNYVQCVKDGKVECKMLIGRDGVPLKMSRLQLNF